MLHILSYLLLGAATVVFGSPTAAPQVNTGPCTPERRIAGTAQLVKTIESHSISDAAQIPLAFLASRTAFLKDTELGPSSTVPVSLGVTAVTVRAILVSAATAISARVLDARYSVNSNGSVTADFIQPDFPVLRCLVVKEIHDYDLDSCEIVRSTVYGFGKIVLDGPNDVFSSIIKLELLLRLVTTLRPATHDAPMKMPSSDYSSAIGGGLKLKGSSSSKIDKTKKNKKKKASSSKPTTTDTTAATTTADTTTSADNDNEQTTVAAAESSPALQTALANSDEPSKLLDATELTTYGKTEAQRRYEERRRKRLEERLQREGVKTHKERVQELNQYLSTLSEHNDMPRIGPGHPRDERGAVQIRDEDGRA
ncbi:hypothetical protein BST61_g4435 [Cercospora zeina]